MAYTREQGIEFWFAFDQRFLFNRPPEVNAAIPIAYPDGNLNDLVDIVKGSLGDADLSLKIAHRRDGILRLADLQEATMHEHFALAADLQRAFEDFGQGVLLDSPTRRPPTRLIHMMDGTPDDWIGYHRWYGFGRSAIALGAPRDSWSMIMRCVALAWAIQSEAQPVTDAPDNPELPADRLDVLRAAWFGATELAVHNAFLSYEGTFEPPNHVGQVRAPAPETLEQATPLTDIVFADVRNILNAATGSASPVHSGEHRFWDLPLAQFQGAVIYGEPVIAPEGDDRGARSALVQVLRGTLSGFPRMPLNRPALPDIEIDAIERWIDEGLPE